MSSKNGLANSKKPIMVEVIGTAGAGKTTLIKSLVENEKNIYIVSKPKLRSVRNLSFVIRNSFSLFSILMEQFQFSELRVSRKIWWLLFLNEVHTGLYEQKAESNTLGMIDHGPIYMLTSLKEFGSATFRTQAFQRWWNEKLKLWTSFLDLVIWLDAPNSVLSERINGRESEHPIKGKDEIEMNHFLDQYRAAFEQVADEIAINNFTLTILQYDSGHKNIDQIKSNILDVVARLDD